jgi:single-strand DNA-binding protein
LINGTQITVIGNVGQEPQLRFTPSGTAVASLSVAVTPRRQNRDTGKWEDGATTWWRVNAWRALAENVAETIAKGMPVVVVGTVAARDWSNDKGEKGTAWEILADSVAVDLRYATAKVTKSARHTDNVPPPEDPWHTPSNGTAAPAGEGYTEGEPPF